MTKKNGTAEPKTETEVLDERALKIARETLTGDVRDIILNDMKERKTSLPWNLRPEEQQRAVIDQVTRMADSIVSRVVMIVAAGGRRTIAANLAKVTIKDGIKAEIELSKFDEQRHQLMDAVGSSVQIVIADKEAFEGDRGPVHVTKDQKEMIDPETGEVTETKPGDIPPSLDRRKKPGADEQSAS